MISSSITVTDMFCGAGGSTTGATMAGAEVKLALNHWKRAIETHNRNHPDTDHALVDLHAEDPNRYPATTVLVASPECTNQTRAKGKSRNKFNPHQGQIWETRMSELAALEERSRCTMWTPLHWAECHNYEVVILENVVDAQGWLPFHAWLQAWKSLGYHYELLSLNSMHVNVPQSRDRMYFVGWKKHLKKPNLKLTPNAFCPHCSKTVASTQRWKDSSEQLAGKYRQQYTYICPDCRLDVTPTTIPAQSIIDWSLPIQKIQDRKKPLATKTMERMEEGLEKYRSSFILDQTAEYRARSLWQPLSTVVAGGNHHGLVVPSQDFILTYYQHGQVVPVQQSLPTVATHDHHALIKTQIQPTGPINLDEIDFRMLSPKEIQAAMAFPASYLLGGTQKEQIKLLGNAVTPPVMKWLMERVMASLGCSVEPEGVVA